MKNKENRKQIKISFNAALVFVLFFSCIMVSLAIYVQVLKMKINISYDEVSANLRDKQKYSITTENK